MANRGYCSVGESLAATVNCLTAPSRRRGHALEMNALAAAHAPVVGLDLSYHSFRSLSVALGK
jgi:hypothetical protein